MQSYNSRLQTLTAGPESYMNIIKSLSEFDLQRLVESEPILNSNKKNKYWTYVRFGEKERLLPIHLQSILIFSFQLFRYKRNKVSHGTVNEHL